jgi:predicted alpha-1,2-mannosidase
MRNYNRLVVALILLLAACSPAKNRTQDDVTKYVNPFIGTGGKGHTYPGASLPFGMVQLSPDNGINGWDEIAGYFYENDFISGFSHTHLSGTGIGDLYDVQLMPCVRPFKVGKKVKDNQVLGIYSSFSHKEEYSEPGYYSIRLKDYDVNVELTATQRAGFHRYTFPQTDSATIVLDLNYSRNWDYTLETELKIVNDSLIIGSRRSKGWADDQRIYFAARFSKPFKSKELFSRELKKPHSKEVGGTGYKAYFNFSTTKKESILVKVGISPVSSENALENLDAEITNWDFDAVRKNANAIWLEQLSKVEIQTSDEKLREIFYTALYQSMLAPTLFSDRDGSYYGPDLKEHKAKGYNNYSTFSLWDTFRAAHPLYTIMHPDRVNDMVKSMLAFYQQGGLLPVWPLAGNETNCMIGYHSVPVIADALLKGIGDFDPELAFEACKATAMSNFRGLDHYKKLGYVPFEKENESVSKTLEYAFDDWCIAQMAKKLGKQEDFNYFMKRAANYKNLYDDQTRFMRPKSASDEWITDFDPNEYTEHYTESNAWHYHFFFPQDVQGAIQLMGGEKNFIAKLDSTFKVGPDKDDKLPIFSTGMIGQYVHGNEPSHHYGYLYNYAGEPWKTQETIRKIIDELHNNTPDGICGNEDCGQMSSWLVFSAMGIYPVNPAEGIYVIGTPVFEHVKLKVGENRYFEIEAENVSAENKYIQSVSLNGEPLSRTYIHHNKIMEGGVLTFVMGPKPNRSWGCNPEDAPPSMTH